MKVLLSFKEGTELRLPDLALQAEPPAFHPPDPSLDLSSHSPLPFYPLYFSPEPLSPLSSFSCLSYLLTALGAPEKQGHAATFTSLGWSDVCLCVLGHSRSDGSGWPLISCSGAAQCPLRPSILKILSIRFAFSHQPLPSFCSLPSDGPLSPHEN